MAQEYATEAFLIARVLGATSVEAADPGAVQRALDDAESMVDLMAYGVRADLAHTYYAAHLLTLRYPSLMGDMGGESRGITSKSAGEISVSFASPAVTGDESDVSRTYWGRLFREQQRIAGATLRVLC